MMRKLTKATWAVAVGCILGFVSGCGGDNNPKTYPVTGVVTLDGTAVEGATVSFVGPKSAVALTDAQGKYAITTFQAGDGALPGDYKVSVSKIKHEGGESPYGAAPESTEAKPMTSEEASAAYGKAFKGPPKGNPKAPKSTNELPEKYNNSDKSGLTHTVPTSPTTFNIELKKK